MVESDKRRDKDCFFFGKKDCEIDSILFGFFAIFSAR